MADRHVDPARGGGPSDGYASSSAAVNAGSLRLVSQRLTWALELRPSLFEDVGDVGLDGALGQEQPGFYLPVAEAAGDKLGDVQFPAGE